MKKLSISLIFFAITFSAFCQVAQYNPQELKRIQVVEHYGDHLPEDLTFTNDKGETVQLKQYFHHKKPVLLVLAYYNCPMLCTLVLNGLADAAGKISFAPYKDYDILTVSIDPKETYQLAAAKKKNYIASFAKPGANEGWSFFVGDESQSRALAQAVGFNYYYDSKLQQFAHPAVVFVLTPDAVISRYLYGIEFNPNDLRLALLEASRGEIGNTIDRIILYCYHYDPDARGYVLLANRIMKLGALASVLALTIFIGSFWLIERKKNKKIMLQKN